MDKGSRTDGGRKGGMRTQARANRKKDRTRDERRNSRVRQIQDKQSRHQPEVDPLLVGEVLVKSEALRRDGAALFDGLGRVRGGEEREREGEE